MSTREYLQKLDLDQLRFARDTADELIKRIESEQKKIIWCVEDYSMTIATFSSDQYLAAADKLAELAKANYRQGARLSSRELELHLVATRVPESEYARWMPQPAPPSEK